MGICDTLANGPLGFGAAPLGNMFRELADEEAGATVGAALAARNSFSQHRSAIRFVPVRNPVRQTAGREGGPEVMENYMPYKSVWIDLF
jgi:hypothetical protein